MANGKSQEEMLQEVYDKTSQIWSAFFGIKDTAVKGLFGDFQEHCQRDSAFRADYYKFKRAVITVFAFLVGSGLLGLSAVKIAEAVAKGG